MFNKIFNIGLPRTGTTSLNQALNALGFKSIHNPKYFRKHVMKGRYHFESNDWRALTNFGEHFYPQLDQAYPNSKFILTVRDEVEWLKSWERQIGNSTGDEVPTRWAWTRPLRLWERKIRRIFAHDTRITHMHARIDIFGTYKFHAERCLYVYRLHRKNVLSTLRNALTISLSWISAVVMDGKNSALSSMLIFLGFLFPGNARRNRHLCEEENINPSYGLCCVIASVAKQSRGLMHLSDP